MAELLTAKSTPAQVVNKYARTVYRLAYSHLGSKEDAEDVMQDVFMTFIRKKPVFNSEEHEKAWFLKVTVNKTRSLANAAWRKRRGEMAPDIPSQDTDPAPDVLAAVLRLPPKYRTVVELFYYEDLPIRQICAVTGASENAVKTQLSRARDMLRDILGKETEI